MPCLHLWPAPVCGWNGRCVQDPNGTEFCECFNGASQSLEMNFMVDEDELNTSLCINHKSTIQILYAVFFVSLIVGLIVSIMTVRSRKDLFELKWWLIFCAECLMVTSYRLTKPDGLLGVDTTFSFLVALGYTLFFMFTYNKFAESLEYGIEKAKTYLLLKYSYFTSRVEQIKKVFLFTSVIAIILSQTFWVSTLIPDRKENVKFFKVFWSWLFIQFCSGATFTYLVYSDVIADLRELVTPKKTEYKPNRPDKELQKLKTMILNTRILMFVLLASHCSWALMSVLVFSDFWLMCWSYLLPIVGIQAAFFGLAFYVSRLFAMATGNKSVCCSQFMDLNTSISSEHVSSTYAGATTSIPETFQMKNPNSDLSESL